MQDDNKKVKDAKKMELKEKSLKGMQKGRTQTDELMKKASREANDEVPVPDDDDAQYYKEEVGEEPDKGIYRSSC